MNEAEITKAVLAALADIAPEIEADTFDRNAMLREEADLDSMDVLNFVVALHERLKVDIPESDYSKMTTLNDCIAYLSERVGEG